jgi:hypothetical protein
LTEEAIYRIAITPNSTDQNGDALPMPPQGLAVGPTGLLTAEYPVFVRGQPQCRVAHSNYTGLEGHRFIHNYG